MKKYILAAFLGGIFIFSAFVDVAAQTQNNRSAYFLEGSSWRHELNPAFMSERNYVSMPMLGNFTVGVQTTGGVGDFLFKQPDGGLTLFMNSSVAASRFLDGIPSRLKVGVGIDASLLGAGFYAWGGFNTFGISLKSVTGISLPDELFRFMKQGVATAEGSHYSVKDVSAVSTNYAEISLGHAHRLNEHLVVGAKLKALVGLAKATMHIDELAISASQHQWVITPSNAELYLSGKGLYVPTKGETGNYQESDYELGADGDRTNVVKAGARDQISYEDIDFDAAQTGPTGFGMAVDLGAEYRLNDSWAFSASLLDLGFISWSNTVKGSMQNTFEFNGFQNIAIDPEDGDANEISRQMDELTDDLLDLSKFTKTGEGVKHTTALAATLHLGAQYTLPVYDRLRFGFLSTTRLQGKHSWSEARLSAMVAPLSWLDATVGYALSGFGSTAGVMLNLHPRYFNFFVAADIPLCHYEPAYYAPVSRAAATVNVGINFTFGKKHKQCAKQM